MAFWSMFRYGDTFTICSKHLSVKAAERAARECEKRGGEHHQILKVTQVVRPKGKL